MTSKTSKLAILVLLFGLAACAPAAPETPAPESNQTVPTPAPAATALPDPSPSPQPARDPDHPRAIVESFYDWYFQQPPGEVLTGRTYTESPFLSDIFRSDVGYLLDDMQAQGPGYDPFTCAQNDLPGLTIAEVFISGGSAYALGEVLIDDEVRHYFVVQLGKGDGSWKIEAVNCPGDPRTTALAFATWYLGFAYHDQDAQAPTEPARNPVAEQAYRTSFLLTGALVERIDEQLEQGADYDPILQAQELPYDFRVLDGPEDGSAVLRFHFGPQSARYYSVYMRSDPVSAWRIDRIEPVPVPVFDPQASPDADLADWQVYSDPSRGFSFRYPADWNLRPMDLSAMPEDDPVKEGLALYAPGLEPDIPALWVNVFEGPEGRLLDYYVTEVRQRVEINGQPVWVDREQCNTRYVFRHPSRTNTWLVFGDACPEMEGREGYAALLSEVIAPLLRSVEME